MASPYVCAVLTVVLLTSGSSRQAEHISICEQPYMGCVGFFNKNDNFSSFHQCLKACDFKKVPGAKPTQAYSCVDYYTPCTALTFYYIPSYLNHFLEWTQCLEVCHLLTNDDGKVSLAANICTQSIYDCFTFPNTKGTVEAFMKCYVECQVTKTENQTHQNYMYVCNPSSRQCIDSLFFTQPEENEPDDALEKCYMDCENGGAASPEPELFKCDQDSKTCKACNEEDDNCSDLATCEDSCQGEPASPEPELFKCDQDSKTCKACNEEDDNCSDLATCEDSCQGEP